MIISLSINILTTIKRGMALKTQGPIYCIKYCCDIRLPLRHTIDRIYLTSFCIFNAFRQLCIMMIIYWSQVLGILRFWILVLQLLTTRGVSALDLLLEYWIEHVTIGLLYVIFVSSTRIFYRWVPGFATYCPCRVLCRGLSTCLLYVGPHFGNLVLNSWFVCSA